RFREESTRANLLVRARLGRFGRTYFDSHGSLRTAPDRTRGDLDLETGIRADAVHFWVGDRLHAQGGSDDPGGGILNVARTGARIRSLPRPLSLRAGFDHQCSRAGPDSLARLFDYHILRPRAEIQCDLGWRGDVSVEAGFAAKRAERGSSSNDRPWLEVSGRYAFPGERTIDVSIRTETRRYLEADSLTPTLHEADVRSRLTLPHSARSRSDWSFDWSSLQYATSSSVFQDHHTASLEGLVSFDLQPRSPALDPWPSDLGEELPDSVLLALDLEKLADLPESSGSDPSLRPRLWCGFGLRGEVLQNEVASRSDYDELAGVVTASREAIAGLWFDLRGEVGRRDYHGTSSGGDLVFEGLDLSLSGTDYRFMSSTLLVEVPLPWSCAFSGFGQFDREWHDESADDFTLWLLTLSLTRNF
ncbi:MAG: hypothetical protein KC729_10550, partial [Candidatus Eisenbacteria bacterium]|nr:hypothetical protein [Candidatus Eisenbacteria bacterium]